MSWHLIHILTYFGDSMLLIPTAIIMALLLLWKSDEKRVAAKWLLTFGVAGLVVSASKIAFLGFGYGIASLNFTGFSGHSAMSATLWPVMLWLLSSRLTGRWRAAAIGLGYLIPLMVGISRLVLHYHSPSEVVAGLILGFSLSSTFLLSHRQLRLNGFSALHLAVVLLLPLLLIGHGRIATTQQFLQRLSVQIAGIDHAWTREDLLRLRNPAF